MKAKREYPCVLTVGWERSEWGDIYIYIYIYTVGGASSSWRVVVRLPELCEGAAAVVSKNPDDFSHGSMSNIEVI